VLTETTVTALEGQDGVLEAIRCRSRRSRVEIRRAIRHLFLFMGADPNTDWLSGSAVRLDDKGLVRTGTNILRPLETSLPGAFAIDDVCPDRSSASSPRSARARRWWRHCTPFSRKPVTKTHFLPISGDSDVRRLQPSRRHS
jgi:thioredoxin reductase